jgi:hypothetical protein
MLGIIADSCWYPGFREMLRSYQKKGTSAGIPWNISSKDFEYLVCNAQIVNAYVKTQQEDHFLNFSVDNTLYSFVNLAAVKPQNAAPILSLVPLHMHGHFHV